MNKGIGIWHCDTQEEREEMLDENMINPDFIYLGHFDSIQDIYFDLNYQGFTDDEITKFTHNRYGNCLEIIEYTSHYDAFIGAR